MYKNLITPTPHRKDCTCDMCRKADDMLAKGQIKRFIPKHILAECAENRANVDELELWKGNIKLPCPSCGHESYMKIGPEMKCPKCLFVIK